MNAMRHQEVTRSADYVVLGLCNHGDRLSLWLKGSHGDLSDELTLRIDTKDTVLIKTIRTHALELAESLGRLLEKSDK